jgi:hypothetical protein
LGTFAEEVAMRRLAIPAVLLMLLAFATPVAASDPTYRATLAGPGPTGIVTIAISGTTGTLQWTLGHLARDSMVTVAVRGGTCASPRGLIVQSRWQARFSNGRSSQTRTLDPAWVTLFNRSWSSRGGDVVTVTNASHTECVAFARR